VTARLDITALAPSTTAATLKTLFAMINSPFCPSDARKRGIGTGL
jgi:hypothetical protein